MKNNDCESDRNRQHKKKKIRNTPEFAFNLKILFIAAHINSIRNYYAISGMNAKAAVIFVIVVSFDFESDDSTRLLKWNRRMVPHIIRIIRTLVCLLHS